MYRQTTTYESVPAVPMYFVRTDNLLVYSGHDLLNQREQMRLHLKEREN